MDPKQPGKKVPLLRALSSCLDFSFKICDKALHQRKKANAFVIAWPDGITHTGKIFSEQSKAFQMNFRVLRDLNGRIGSPFAPGLL